MEDHEIPVVNIVVKFKTGFPPEDKLGLNDVAGWALRNAGTKSFSKETLDRELEFVDASIESYSGIYIGQVSANFLTKDTDKVLEMLADVIVNPAPEPAKIDLRKNSLIENIRRKADDPYALGHREFSKIVYRDHPAGLEATVATVAAITPQDVAAFLARYVRPDNAVIGISGDITRDQALDRIGHYFGAWQPGGEPPSIPEMEYKNLPSVNYIYKDLNQAYIFVGHMGINSRNPDLPFADIMDYILGSGSFSSWIMRRVRSDEGLAYDAGSDFEASPWGYGLFTAWCQTRNDAAMRALAILIEQIEKMKNEGPSQGEVSAAKDSFVNTQAFAYESSSRVIDRLAEYYITGLPLDTLERELKQYQAASLEDIKGVGSRYLHPEGLTILVIGNRDLFDRPLSDFGEVHVIDIGQEEVTSE
jgi:zinc protease